MSEGTKIGEFKESTEFSEAIRDEGTTDVFEATKRGELSEFESALAQSEPQDKEETDFEKLMQNDIADYQEGDIIKGIVRSIEKGGILVDINYKSDGFIGNNEISDSDELKVGDEILVFIEKLETKEGYTILSRRKAEYEETWNALVDATKDKTTVEVKVNSQVQGGLVASYKGIKGFIPASQVMKENEEDLEGFIGQVLEVSVLQADRRRRKVIFSHKFAQNKTQRIALEEALEKIEVGETREGKVTSIKDFGVFVDIGNIEGLVHISELSWSRVRHPSDHVNVGDAVKVFILGVDKENKKISLGMKQLEEDPWVKVASTFTIGQRVSGKVTRVVPFGAFFQINDSIEGLIHISELSNGHVAKVEDIVKVGDERDAVIIKLIPEEQKIGLSLKSAQEDGAVEIPDTTETAETTEETTEAPESTDAAEANE